MCSVGDIALHILVVVHWFMGETLERQMSERNKGVRIYHITILLKGPHVRLLSLCNPATCAEVCMAMRAKTSNLVCCRFVAYHCHQGDIHDSTCWT